MIFARNAQEVGFEYGEPYLLARDQVAWKLTVRVKEAPVVVQVTEQPEKFFENESQTEHLLEVGFHSMTFITPITGWRFRSWGAEPGVIDFIAYA